MPGYYRGVHDIGGEPQGCAHGGSDCEQHLGSGLLLLGLRGNISMRQPRRPSPARAHVAPGLRKPLRGGREPRIARKSLQTRRSIDASRSLRIELASMQQGRHSARAREQSVYLPRIPTSALPALNKPKCHDSCASNHADPCRLGSPAWYLQSPVGCKWDPCGKSSQQASSQIYTTGHF